ncbi:hypothetical protein AVEN_244622-1 [Araneus ventricosus]|uniref:Uncharacterized protein n=1 Tax=Araneus ventricosus TaxID=182803 RepID=A0A4Y2IL31_ARAVE|nr:hypothetical protein AVEN_244622-1 [Araneus ventricosus]
MDVVLRRKMAKSDVVDGNDHCFIVIRAVAASRVKVSFTCLLLAGDASDRMHMKSPIGNGFFHRCIMDWRSLKDYRGHDPKSTHGA